MKKRLVEMLAIEAALGMSSNMPAVPVDRATRSRDPRSLDQYAKRAIANAEEKREARRKRIEASAVNWKR